jgi:hypothetical protein
MASRPGRYCRLDGGTMPLMRRYVTRLP